MRFHHVLSHKLPFSLTTVPTITFVRPVLCDFLLTTAFVRPVLCDILLTTAFVRLVACDFVLRTVTGNVTLSYGRLTFYPSGGRW